MLFNAGDIAYKKGNFQQAKAYFEQALLLVDPSHDLYQKIQFNRGNCYFQEREFKKAIAAYDTILESNKDDEKALYNMNKAIGLLKEEERKESFYNLIEPVAIQ